MPVPEIGHSIPRPDAWTKVTGAERFATDHYGDDLLWAGVRRAGIPHGRLRGVDADAARRLPGVVAVLTGADVPGTNRQGIVHKDQPVLCTDKVRHCGDAVALVIAESREALAEALALIRPDIEPLPGVFTLDEALAPHAPPIHEGHPGGNVLVQGEIRKGDAEAQLAACDVVIEATFTVPAVAHAFLETENGVAWQEADGRIVLVVSTQAPFRDRWEIGHALGIPLDRIRIIAPFPGGAFGGKDGATVQCLLALAAPYAGGRPVKMWWDRQESFLAGYKRHAARMHYRLGARADGTIAALHARLWYDTGAYAHLGGEVLALGMEHAAGPYRIPHSLVEGWCLYTNNPIAGAMRGFGVAQVSFASEGMLDRLAARLGRDPLDLRLQNALRPGDRNAAGVTLASSTGIVPCLETLAAHPRWRDREAWIAAAGPFKRRGVGVAAVGNAMGYGRGLPDSALAKIELTPEGRIVIHGAVPDMGQGNGTAFVQIAGEILRQDGEAIDYRQPDTETALPSGSASASRTTYTYGNALIAASEELRRRIVGRAALMLLVDRLEDLEILPGRVRQVATGREIAIAALAATMTEHERICISQFLMPVALDRLETGKAFPIGFPHLLFAYAAHLARLEADELTGQVEVKDYLAVTEAGRILNPQGLEQQVQGAIAQGIGYALTEEVLLAEGHIVTPDLATYIIPSALDVPEMTSLTVMSEEPSGPFGMKGAGEVGINGPLPAIAGALSRACGVDLAGAPLTAERVLEALRCGRQAVPRRPA